MVDEEHVFTADELAVDELPMSAGAWGVADVGSMWTRTGSGVDFTSLRPGDRFTVESALPPQPGTRAIVTMPDGSTVEAVVVAPQRDRPIATLKRRPWWKFWRRRG